MARPRKVQSTTHQIEQLEALVLKKKEEYDAAVTSLKEAWEKLENENQKALLEAVSRSKWSYEKIMEFIQSDPEEYEE